MRSLSFPLLLWLTALGARAGETDAGAPAAGEELAPAALLRDAVDRHAAGDDEGALALLERLEARAEELPEALLARVHFARGVVLAEAAEDARLLEAADPFLRARALAGPGTLREDATYDAGWVHLLEGERRRREIPELGGAPPAGPAAPPPAAGAGAGAAPGAQPPDPLAEARAAYERAREILVERLRSDWRDEDTRANLELIQRRLKELDRIERERREQEDPNQEGQPDSDSSDSDSKGQPQDSQDKGDDTRDEEGGDSQEERQDQEGEEPQAGDDEERPADEGEQEDAAEPLETQQEEGPAQQEEPRPAQGAGEEHLSREEVIQLLDKLAEIEAAAEARRAALRRAARRGVARDW